MSAKSDGLIGNHVPHHRTAALPTVDEGEEEDQDSPETSSTPPDDVTALEAGDPGAAAEEDDVDEPMAMSSSELTLSDSEVKDAVPNGPVVEPTVETTTAGALDSVDQSSTSSDDDFDPGTIVRRRRDATAFLGDDVDRAEWRRRAAELGYSDNDDDGGQDDDWDSSDDEDDEYIGLVPMLCSRCARCVRRHWFEQRAKHFLVLFNVVFCMCGLALVCVGLWMYICHDSLFYGVLLLDNPTSPLVFLRRLVLTVLGVGSILAAMCFVGGCGAATECICFIVLHVLVSALCILAQIVAAILWTVHQETIRANMSTSMQYQLRHLYNATGTARMNTSSVTYRVTVAWDQMQRQLECCGALGPADYHNSAWFNHTPDFDGSFVPPSCCGATSHNYFCQFEAVAVIQDDVKPHSIVYAQGCFDALFDWYATYRPLVAFIVVIIDILLLIDIISSLVLVRIIQRKHADYGWRPNYY